MNKHYLDQTWLAQGDELDAAVYPQISSMSSAFFYRFLPQPKKMEEVELLYVSGKYCAPHLHLRLIGLMATWNLAWEAGQYRSKLTDKTWRQEMPHFKPLLKKIKDTNVHLLVDSKQRFEAYSPLLMLLPGSLTDKYNLPRLRRVLWPGSAGILHNAEAKLPNDFRIRLGSAFAEYIWPFLTSGSGKMAFSKDEPIKLLAHSLDYWLPHITKTIQNRLLQNDFCDFDDDGQRRDFEKLCSRVPSEADFSPIRVRHGGYVWLGEDEAREATREMVEFADREGKLRALIDAVRSNRVEEDFSPRWSYAREDFERRLYKKRSKVKVKFVEIEHAGAIAGPDSEFSEKFLWRDFMGMLNAKEKEVVVFLARGETSLTEIARSLGYANHSPISKALTRIRTKAREYFS